MRLPLPPMIRTFETVVRENAVATRAIMLRDAEEASH
jgi:hypothetical protein